ncbi:hypothetical protein GCM10023184_06630 [Flaviaesturariibacter amylovorans]|uniref:Uncharacterized protein n=1 Tax=Flaviaesturariibacter amylovorans TaxID=1084520 RepID=A0ABP8GB80_9BACT
MIYRSELLFKLWAYSVSHNILTLRGSNNSDLTGENYNVEIEFYGVKYIDLPVIMHGVTIDELRSNVPRKFSEHSIGGRYKVFELQNESNSYLVASSCIIGKHNWGDECDRISNPSLVFDEIIFM